MKKHGLLIAGLLCVASPIGMAADQSNDESKYQGDILSFPVRIHGTYAPGFIPRDKPQTVCIPADTSVRALGEYTDENDPKKTRYVNVRLHRRIHMTEPGTDCDGNSVPADVIIRIKEDDLNNSGPNRYGLTYGALVVPYKYHVSGSKSFDGSSSIAPFLGYRADKAFFGFSVKGILFAGASAIRVNRTDQNGQSRDDTLAGFTYGLGILGTVKKEFQLGIVFGADRVSHGSDYADNGKWWGAVALGFSFAN